MLTMRIPRDKDKNRLEMFLNENNLTLDLSLNLMVNSMIVEEKNNIIGFSNYIIVNGICEIQNIFVQPSLRRRKIGDGLIRALLNLATKREIAEVYIEVKESDLGFINYVGLDKVSEKTYKVTLPDFFERPCRSEKKTK